MYRWLKVLTAGLIVGALAGCSQNTQSPSAGGPAEGKDNGISARATEGSEAAEDQVVAQLYRDRADYKRILQVLKRWYLEKGYHERAMWAEKELHDLAKVRTYPYLKDVKGAESVKLGNIDESDKSSLQSIDLKNFSEADWIEQLNTVRQSYKMVLKKLMQEYESTGDARRAGWANKELDDLNHVRQFAYLVEVDIQNTDLVPKDSIVEADKLYDEAYRLHHRALFLPFINNKRQLKEAMDKYILVIKLYPTSDKIDDAAYMAGEISKEYFDDDVQAVRYSETALKFNPKTPHKARFQCAVIYDYRLHDRARAMAMYQRVLTEEQDIDQTNTTFAATRLRQLLEQGQQTSANASEAPPSTSTPTMQPAGK